MKMRAMMICVLMVMGVLLGSAGADARQAAEPLAWEEWKKQGGDDPAAVLDWRKNYERFEFAAEYQKAGLFFWKNVGDLKVLKKYFIDNAQSQIKEFTLDSASVSLSYSGEGLAKEEFCTVEDACRHIYQKNFLGKTDQALSVRLHNFLQDDNVLYVSLYHTGALTYRRYPVSEEEVARWNYVCHLSRNITKRWTFTQVIAAGANPPRQESPSLSRQAEPADLSKETLQEVFALEKEKFAALAETLNQHEMGFAYTRKVNYARKEDRQTYDIYNTAVFYQGDKDESQTADEKMAFCRAAENFMAVLQEHGLMPSEQVEIVKGASKKGGKCINIYFKEKNSDKIVLLTHGAANGKKAMRDLGANWRYAVISPNEYSGR